MKFPKLTGEQILNEARTHLGTPFHLRAATSGAGLDCIGLIKCTFEELGIDMDEAARNIGMARFMDYSAGGDEFLRLELACAEFCDLVWKVEDGAEPDLMVGDILGFRFRGMQNHCSIYAGDGKMIHSHDAPRILKVAEHPMDMSWNTRLARVWRYKGLKL